jgi:hypothetical protein
LLCPKPGMALPWAAGAIVGPFGRRVDDAVVFVAAAGVNGWGVGPAKSPNRGRPVRLERRGLGWP